MKFRETMICGADLLCKPWRKKKCWFKPKYKITYKDGTCSFLCGMHKNKELQNNGEEILSVEEISK